MAKIEVQLEKTSDVLLQGDVVIVDWEDKTQSTFIVYCFSEPNKKSQKTLCSLDGGCSLCHYTNLGDMTRRELQQRLGVRNKVTVIKRENLHMIVKDTSL